MFLRHYLFQQSRSYGCLAAPAHGLILFGPSTDMFAAMVSAVMARVIPAISTNKTPFYACLYLGKPWLIMVNNGESMDNIWIIDDISG